MLTLSRPGENEGRVQFEAWSQISFTPEFFSSDQIGFIRYLNETLCHFSITGCKILLNEAYMIYSLVGVSHSSLLIGLTFIQ